MLLANNIFFKRNNKIILSNINISISPGKILHLKGNNGIGKTTLLKILTNIIQPEKGEIFWKGKNIKKNPHNLYKDLTFIIDKQVSNNNLTTIENITFWKKLFSSKIKNNQIKIILDSLSLSEYMNTQISNLSYGEIKKLELSRLIIEQKKLWILDEPYIGLDNLTTRILNETINSHLGLGGMVIFTSHIHPEISNLENYELKND